MKSNKTSPDNKRQNNIILAISIIIVVVLVAVIILVVNLADKKGTSDSKSVSTDKPVATTTASSDTAPTVTPDQTSNESTSTSLEHTDATPVRESSISDNDALTNVQKTFDNYIKEKNYSAALDLIVNDFSNSDFSLSRLSTYRNYVTYYEAQKQYETSLAYQLDYIENKDGLDNVRASSVHYELLMETLKHVSSSDERIQKIKDSVARWSEIEDLIKNNSYDQALQKLLDLKNGGLDCAILYYMLGNTYTKQQEYVKAMECYIEYIDNHSNYNQLENDLVEAFKNRIVALHYNGQLTDEDIEPYEDREDIFANDQTGAYDVEE